MMKPQKSNINLSKLNTELELSEYYKKQEYIRQTAAQIIKDFAEFGLEITFSGDTDNAYQELFDQLNNHMEVILAGQFHMLFNMLYRIDLSEQAIMKSEALHPDYSKSEVISDLIIQRELKKVLIRSYFKEQGNTAL
jgi:hypothetical protein